MSHRIGHAAVTRFDGTPDSVPALRRAVELVGGMPWLQPGDSVLIKPAHNSAGKFPLTASPVACAELVRLCLENGAGRVVVADEMGFEHTMFREWVTGGFAGPEKDRTIRAMNSTGLYDAVHSVAKELGTANQVRVTTFREDGWVQHDLLQRPTTADGAEDDAKDYVSHLYSEWMKTELNAAQTWAGSDAHRIYYPRFFDAGRDNVPGMFVPQLMNDVDHIINLYRVSTHIWSHFTMSIKNWVGIMRPDERVWMHQLNYLKNNRHRRNNLPDDHPLRTEPLYHELLADLHLPHADKERLCLADASQIVVSGGPDHSDHPYVSPQVALAATDLVSADVLGLAVLRYGTLKAPDGLRGQAEPQVQKWTDALISYYVKDLCWPEEEHLFRGTDEKLCDERFSNWDWVQIQRARELGLGPVFPDDLELVIDDERADARIPDDLAAWINEDVHRPPQFTIDPVESAVEK